MGIGLGTAVLIGAGVAAVGAGASAVQSKQSADSQRKGVRRQDEAQQQAKQSALAQQIRSEQTQAAANRKSPDIASLLAFEQSNASPTALGVDRSKQKLGKPSLLGDV